MTSEPSAEKRMTDIYTRNLWGCSESRSGPTATLQRTQELREQLPELFRSLGIQTILDVGCGEFNWMQHVDLSQVEYLGVDIVPDLIASLQKSQTRHNIKFQKMNVLEEPPETADLWFCRDFLNLLDTQQTAQFFSKFLESKSLFLALTSIQSNQPNTDGYPGVQRIQDLFQAPFMIPEPVKIMFDGEQWFRRRILAVFSRDQVETWWQTNHRHFMSTTSGVDPQHMADGTQGTNASLKSNISLKNYPIHGHMGLPA